MSGGIHEDVAVVATVDPDVYVASSENTDEVDMSIFDEMKFVVMTGTLGASARRSPPRCTRRLGSPRRSGTPRRRWFPPHRQAGSPRR